MSSIVLELESAALAGEVDVLLLLRKAKVVARKLKLREFEAWADCELRGYGIDDSVPEYRSLRGDLKAWNPYNGWIPVVGDGTLDVLKEQRFLQGIAELVDLYESGSDPIVCNFNDEVNAVLNKVTSSFTTKYSLHVSRSQLKGVIERVKTIVLEWALILEDDGILGEGMSFSAEEQEAAADSGSIQNYVNYVYGDVSELQLQQGAQESCQGRQLSNL